jgi:hypothetical protein
MLHALGPHIARIETLRRAALPPNMLAQLLRGALRRLGRCADIPQPPIGIWYETGIRSAVLAATTVIDPITRPARPCYAGSSRSPGDFDVNPANEAAYVHRGFGRLALMGG